MRTTAESINLDIFMSSGNERSLAFMKEFASIGKQLTKHNSEFTPHYVFIKCLSCEATGFNIIQPDCLGGGRYCAPDPDGPGPISGRHVVMEDLRQLCAYEQIKDESEKSYQKWFQFQKSFADKCYLKIENKECSDSVMKEAGINIVKVNECYEKSFASKEENWLSTNSKLQDEMDFWLSNGLHFYPAIMINGQLYRGDLENSAVLIGMCAGYASDSQPGFCTAPETVIMEGYSTKSVVLALLVFFGILITVLFAYRHFANKQMDEEVKKQASLHVSQYFALSEASAFKKSDRQTVKSSYV
jgi:hypothetical protein